MATTRLTTYWLNAFECLSIKWLSVPVSVREFHKSNEYFEKNVVVNVNIKLDSLDSIDSFVETENGYEVSPAEGFVAVDRMGDAVKIVDRLDFSAKNFSKPKADKFN